jgi:hypothetical protein
MWTGRFWYLKSFVGSHFLQTSGLQLHWYPAPDHIWALGASEEFLGFSGMFLGDLCVCVWADLGYYGVPGVLWPIWASFSQFGPIWANFGQHWQHCQRPQDPPGLKFGRGHISVWPRVTCLLKVTPTKITSNTKTSQSRVHQNHLESQYCQRCNAVTDKLQYTVAMNHTVHDM